MINLTIVSCGIILLIYSVVLCHTLNTKIDRNIVQKPSSLISILIYLFILGYVVFLWRLIITIASHNVTELLVSGIFFFGALFVVIVLRVNYKLILKLTENSLRLGELNTVLENKNKELSHKTEELKKSEEKYIKRSKELDETLENFYTMRIGLQKQIDKDTIEEENRKIKERLDEARSKN